MIENKNYIKITSWDISRCKRKDLQTMKRNTIITFVTFAAVSVALTACHDKTKPGKAYMPDMTYSRAIETYAQLDSTKFTEDSADRGRLIFYNRKPVDSTMTVDGLAPFMAPPPSPDSAGYRISASIKNPLAPLTTADSLEASRLFNINCAVCHGAKAEANGPVAPKIGGVKSIVAAAAGNSTTPGYSDGRIYYIMTYGQGNMGSYASQLSRKQRWMIVQYIRTLQPKPDVAPAGATKVDSAAAKTK